MRRLPAVLIIGVSAGIFLSTASHAGGKPDAASATPAGWAADRDLWEKRAEQKRAERKLIKDAGGRTHYIVELDRDAPARYDQTTPPNDGFASWHKPGTRHLVQDLKREYGFEPTSITSLIGPSFQAYLDDNQVAALRADRRVVRVVEDHVVEFSGGAVWADAPVGADTKPWGVQAVGGGVGSSNGGITVYVLDSGVNAHPDINLVEQASVQAGISPIGCYGHGTHVAGIIGAKSGNGGVVGVFPNVRIVSLSVSTTNEPGGCADVPSSGNFRDGLEQIKQRIAASGRVAIINISANGVDFQPTGIIAPAILDVVTPTPSEGYAGAFLTQSAGNDYSASCATSYTGAGSVMVVGAIDDHGQRVVPLNQLPGFVSMPYASDEIGSNYGSCVSVWAPGSRILSTWTGGGYVPLSGTSMAAPHVAGVAAYLAETGGLNTPGLIWSAVRSTMVPIQGAGISIPNLSYQGAVATPTVRFAEGPPGPKQTVGNFTAWHIDRIAFFYDSIGATTCDLTGYLNNGLWYSDPGFLTSYIWPPATLQPGNYRWDLDCVSPDGTHGTAEATATIKRQVTQAYWSIATASTNYAWVSSGTNAALAGPYLWSATGPLYQKIVSQNADHCQVRSYGWTGSPTWNRTLLWDSGPNWPANYPFQPFYLGDPHTAAPPLGPYDGYLWQLTCTNSDGGSAGSTMWGYMQP